MLDRDHHGRSGCALECATTQGDAGVDVNLIDERIEDMLMLLGSRSRLRVIRSLADGPLDVKSVMLTTGLPQNLVSYNLRTMYRSGLVTITPERTRRIYSLNPNLRVVPGEQRVGMRIAVGIPGSTAILLDTVCEPMLDSSGQDRRARLAEEWLLTP